jgi:sensor histidine kinase YesM
LVAISFLVTNRIYKPLNLIYEQIKGFKLDSTPKKDPEKPSDFKKIVTHIKEIDTLYSSLLNMQDLVNETANNEIQLQHREMQAHMLALQSQMNPHFLYNSLAVIQAMSDEKMNDEIIYMCQNISEILRYISANSDQFVSLEEELNCTENYLKCMQLRYNTALTYHIHIPDSMLSIQVPKLCLQPIVENAIKYCTKSLSPWHIALTGTMNASSWEVNVHDNGPGFSQEKIAELNEHMLSIDQTHLLPNLEIKGMGLLNIYIRLNILYNNNGIFRISNNTTKGATVTIGGKML